MTQSDEFQDDESEQYFSTSFTDASRFGDSTNSTYFTSPSMPGNAQPDCDVDLDRLLSIGRDIASPDPTTQLAAVHSAMLVFNQINEASPSTLQSHIFSSSEGGNRSFSDTPYPRPPSTRTSLLSSTSKISKGKNRARTAAVSVRSSSVASSAGASKCSKITHAQSTMANAAAMTGMTGAINWATDCMKGMQELLVVPTASPLASAPGPSISPQPLSIRSLATAHLNDDAGLNVTIRAELALEFLINDSFCQMYAELTDPMVRQNVALSWYQKKHATVATLISSPSAPSSASFFSEHDKWAPAATPSFFPSDEMESAPALYDDEVSLAGPSTGNMSSSILFSGHGNLPVGVISGGDTSSNMDYDVYYDTSYLDTSGS